MSNYHNPVLLHESVDALVYNPDGIYVDVTFGGGGHSRLILSRLSSAGRLIAFDRDTDALANVPDDPRFTLVNHNFRYLKQFLLYLKAIPVNGILADLGISSHQIDEGTRGFAHRLDGPLDMRMDSQSPLTAEHVVNTYDAERLQLVFQRFGEIPNAKTLATTIVNGRKAAPILTTGKLKEAIASCTPRQTPAKYLSQVFQALRIEVNGEMTALEELLQRSGELIITGGKLVIISYHSLEDRLVKHYLQTGNLEGERHTDLYGHVSKPFTMKPGKAIAPGAAEIENNKRARSAKMRIGIRN
ncbi:MAG: 16S rRNA (cytosine(1402)-N(4))-methyltransferase RsmH [Bacteroidetes bacterium]|nr:16S rRNA (cytosine(1402)-N(4))-methyltransferase RsmH [Bacteroidota bacterium]